MNCFSKKSPQLVDDYCSNYYDDLKKGWPSVYNDMVRIHGKSPPGYNGSLFRDNASRGPYYAEKYNKSLKCRMYHAFLGVTLEEASLFGYILPINDYEVFNIDLGGFDNENDAAAKCVDAGEKLSKYISDMKQKQLSETRKKIMEIVM